MKVGEREDEGKLSGDGADRVRYAGGGRRGIRAVLAL